MMYTKGQITTLALVISSVLGLLTVGGSVWGARIAANDKVDDRVNEVNTKVEVVEERENNHFLQVSRDLDRIEDKLDKVIDSL